MGAWVSGLRFLRKAAGCLLTTGALGGAVFSAIGLLAPSQVPLSDDGAPFAAGPTRATLLLQCAACIALLVLGLRLMFVRRDVPRAP